LSFEVCGWHVELLPRPFCLALTDRFARSANPKTPFARCTFLGDEWLIG
jgi:hypothetical protein